MEKLRFRTEPKQLRGLLITLILIGVITALSDASALRQRAWSPETGAIIAGVIGLLGAWVYVMYAFAFTECTAVGIRTLGLTGPRKCSWPDVADIGIRYGTRGIATVTVATVGGRRFMLGAPVDGGVMADPQFQDKVGQIRSYWQSFTDPVPSSVADQ